MAGGQRGGGGLGQAAQPGGAWAGVGRARVTRVWVGKELFYLYDFLNYFDYSLRCVNEVIQFTE